MDKRSVLTNTDFGKRIAEDERNELDSYFVQTEQWQGVFSGEIDVVYGPKGSGKSAIYSLLIRKSSELFNRGILVVPGEDVIGTSPVFSELLDGGLATEEQLRGLWKLYFLSLLAFQFREHRISNSNSRNMIRHLEDAGLVPAQLSLRRILRSTMEYIKRLKLNTEVKLNPLTGLPEALGGSITLGEPTTEQRELGFVSADELFGFADAALSEASLKVWIVLDRLDVAFIDSPELETKALRSLFRTYRDLAPFTNIAIKIFMRDDIWTQITEQGFREASHITRYTKLSWDERSLLHLVISRVLHNAWIRTSCGIAEGTVLSREEQERLFYRIFPSQIVTGKGSATFKWMLSRTCDSTKQTAPRDLIHLLSSARSKQLQHLELGAPEPAGELLIDRNAFDEALEDVSKERFDKTLCAEHAALAPRMRALEGQKTQHSAKSLARVWGVDEERAKTEAKKLVEIGFFEKRTNQAGEASFWVPFVYRSALKLLQGQAR
jgi:hypothetical protein